MRTIIPLWENPISSPDNHLADLIGWPCSLAVGSLVLVLVETNELWNRAFPPGKKSNGSNPCSCSPAEMSNWTPKKQNQVSLELTAGDRNICCLQRLCPQLASSATGRCFGGTLGANVELMSVAQPVGKCIQFLVHLKYDQEILKQPGRVRH